MTWEGQAQFPLDQCLVMALVDPIQTHHLEEEVHRVGWVAPFPWAHPLIPFSNHPVPIPMEYQGESLTLSVAKLCNKTIPSQ